VVNLSLDVTDAAGLGEPATVAATVCLPNAEDMTDPPVVCFAKPGGGYSKEYFTEDLPGPVRGSQARWHARRGWIVVAVDHLGTGSSSMASNALCLDYSVLVAGNHAAELQILSRLTDGTLCAGFPAITKPLLLGIGQSMGGCMTVIQQGRYHCYDGIAVLGYSAIHTHPPVPPGSPAIVAPWIPRDTMHLQQFVVTNAACLADAELVAGSPAASPAMAWACHFDDIDPGLQRIDLENFPTGGEDLPPWRSRTIPIPVALATLTPGAIAPEAAAVTTPVLVAMGERDVIADPKGEPRAYLSATSVDLFICPRMGHMHNFAGTRELLWRRIDTWATWVIAVKAGVRVPSRLLRAVLRVIAAGRRTATQSSIDLSV
jgi:alpha-beta hydrolase superfamily lysophospholipase